MAPSSASKPVKSSQSRKKAKQEAAASASSSDEQDVSAYSSEESNDDEVTEEAEIDSDAIDDDPEEESEEEEIKTPKKRKSPSRTSSPKTDKKGQRKIADLVPAPKKTAPAGELSSTTLKFLRDLAKENEREWLQRNDAPYRHAMNEWKAFVDAASEEMSQVDWSLPILPAKDLVHRLARDIRFSNDKTPYKTSFQASFSRTGRKGPYAGYFLLLKPGGQSMIAGGKWGPEKNELATIRTNILRKPQKLRNVIGAPAFVKMFGEAKPAGKGVRRNIFGRDDELKNAPKLPDVDKTHKDIDLLKCKSFVVSKTIPDADILATDAIKRIGKIVAVMAPLVQLLNDMIMPQSDAEDSSSEEEETNAQAQASDEEGE